MGSPSGCIPNFACYTLSMPDTLGLGPKGFPRMVREGAARSVEEPSMPRLLGSTLADEDSREASFGHRPEPAFEEALELPANDAEAVERAYEAHHTDVRAFCRRLIGAEAEAEDLVQEVFLALPNALRSFRGDCSLRTLLLSIAVHRSKDHIRAAARRRAALGRMAMEPKAAPSMGPDENQARSQLAAALTRALDALPVEQRLVFVLCEVEERTSKEVARIVGAPEATVRARLRLAKEKLRERLVAEGFR